MNAREILSHIDHTLLKPAAAWTDIQALCEEAVRYKTASVCIPPCYVQRVREFFPALNICTVAGFPLGYCVTAAKLAETEQALTDGADEVDMVVNVAEVKNGSFSLVTEEIRRLKAVCGGKILKVIVETCFLTRDEKIALCGAVTEAGADYIKTSTGFGSAGAALEDIALFQAHIGPNVKIKAAGGIRTREALEAFLAAGCDRVGSSAAVALLRDEWERLAGKI